jgi:hypothetical protein
MRKPILLLLVMLFGTAGFSQYSIAREWNEVLLFAIRNDLARPTVHARNLHHISAAMYDAWVAYDLEAKPYFLGNIHNDYFFEYDAIPIPEDIESARKIAISHAAYNLIYDRFFYSPGADDIIDRATELAMEVGINIYNTSTDYKNGGPAELGNYIAQQVLAFGMSDGSNEDDDYRNIYYESVNPPLAPVVPGNSLDINPNRWQPLSLSTFIDQSGNVIPFNTPEFLSPEWGSVYPFSLNDSDKNTYTREEDVYHVYLDPGSPPFIGSEFSLESNEAYKWGFCLVSLWSSHLDTTSEVIWDISPASIGNVQSFPETFPEYQEFYLNEGGDSGKGYEVNPHTGKSYDEYLVPRSDFGRVVAEYWADGPDSETPPGHWFTIFNEVSESELLSKKIGGQGEEVDDLEWDIKGHFILGGAMHDAAVAAWGVKGYYDYIRPISAIRYLAEKGQCTDPEGSSFDPDGINLIEGYIELVEEGDPLAGETGGNIGKIKVNAWKGPDYIENPETDAAGAGWILAENWWPYQRPTFVTPNFAGYVSGHSTFSRAAAEVLTAYTGDPFFPGGYGEFVAKKHEFLVFEEGPTRDVTLQWATYRDAANQSALSRIWGGIHPPADDIPGRIMGEKIGLRAYDYGISFFSGSTSTDELIEESKINVFPNPIPNNSVLSIKIDSDLLLQVVDIYDLSGQVVYTKKINSSRHLQNWNFALPYLSNGTYIVSITCESGVINKKLMVIN